jgi:glutamyl-tRNA reductase
MVSFLGAEGVAEVVVANRTPQRAEANLDALKVPARVVPLSALAAELRDADVVFGATSAPEIVLDRAGVEEAVAGRDRPLLAIDVAVPRDIDPAVASLEGVELLDMRAVAEITEAGLQLRHREAEAVRRIVEEEVRRYTAAASAREVAPLITSLHERAEQVRVAELERFAAKLGWLEPDERAAVDALTRGLLAKLLHDPTVRLKDAAGSSRGERLASSLAELFDL